MLSFVTRRNEAADRAGAAGMAGEVNDGEAQDISSRAQRAERPQTPSPTPDGHEQRPAPPDARPAPRPPESEAPADPRSGLQQATPPEAPKRKKPKRKARGRTISFLTVLFPMLTALITFLVTLVGLWWPANEDRNEKADQAAALGQQVQDLNIELEDQQEANGNLQNDVDGYVATVTSLQDQLDQLSTTTTVGSPDDPDDGSLPRGPDGEVAVFRETGDQPLRLNEGYWVNLDTLDDNWGISDLSASASDINLRSLSSTGLELRSLSDVVAVMDHEASYEECDATTDLRDEVGSGLTVEGTQFCTRTDQGRWAFITILEVGRADGFIVLDITVWEPQT